jgi:RNA polymerase sigma factor (TIGR02999 family)
MRSIIVDAVRASKAERRGGDASHVPLDSELIDRIAAPEDEILGVHDALEALAKIDERLSRVVEMRYFGGMSDAEIGEALEMSERTVRRDWEKARMLLALEMRSG